MSLSSDILPGGRTCADPAARSVVGHVHAQFVKDVSGSKCRRIAPPVPTASPRLTTHDSFLHSFTRSLVRSFTFSLPRHLTVHEKQLPDSLLHSFTFSLLHSYTSSLIHRFTRSLAPSFPVFLIPEP